MRVELACRCGEVQGHLTEVSPKTTQRVVCYCDDCQAFAHRLRCADWLDEHGGSDIVQVAPDTMTIDRGQSHVAALRLSPKGLLRYYASCCDTPLGNTVGPMIPFVGLLTGSFPGLDAATLDRTFGPPRARILGKFAVGTPPEGSSSIDVKFLAATVAKILGWKLTGRAWPHPFFERDARAKTGRLTGETPIKVLDRAERDALRPKCGPVATQVARG